MWFIDDAQCIEYNQEYKNKRPSVDALEIKGILKNWLESDIQHMYLWRWNVK